MRRHRVAGTEIRGRVVGAVWIGLGLGLLAVLAGTGAAWGATLHVPAPGAPTVASALRQARPGDRIVLAPGVYRERLVLSRPVTLTGPRDGPLPVLDGGGAGRVLELRGPDITLDRLAVRNSGDRLEKTDACVYVHGEATRARVLRSRLTACAFGIWVNGTRDVELAHNTIRGRTHPIFSDRGNGINLWQIRGGRIHDNDIAETRDGVYLSVTKESVVEGNRMRDLRFGVHYMYSDRNRVVGNVTCDSQVGLALMFSKRLEVRGNAAIRNRDHGILFRSILDSRIVGNRVEGNGKGFFLNDATFNEIRGNRVARNAIGVHVTGGSEENTVTGNAIMHNPVQVRFAWNFPIRWDDGKQGNYWSDYVGWDLDGDRRGDRPHHASGHLDRLMVRYPVLRMLAASPVLMLLQAVEGRFPVLRAPSIVDRHPQLRPRGLQGQAADDTVAPCAPPDAEASAPATAAAAVGRGVS